MLFPRAHGWARPSFIGGSQDLGHLNISTTWDKESSVYISGIGGILPPVYSILQCSSSPVVRPYTCNSIDHSSWTEECERAFISLQTALTETPVLVSPDPREGLGEFVARWTMQEWTDVSHTFPRSCCHGNPAMPLWKKNALPLWPHSAILNLIFSVATLSSKRTTGLSAVCTS